jgi:hypothetical protein
VLPIALTFRTVFLRVRVISKPRDYNENMAKSRGINADIQSPRTKLLYTIYSASNSRIKAEPGVKSSLSSALGYKSDGHFHYDWNYLVDAGMIEEKQGYFMVTEHGKREFALHETAFRSNISMVAIGVAIIFFTISLELGLLPNESVIFFGITLIVVGSLFLVVNRRNRPKLPPEVGTLLKELNRH